MLEAYLKMWETGYYEVKFALEGLSDENVWKRPTEGLLSVGELAGHVAFWEAVKFAGEVKEGLETDLSTCKIKSPLIDDRFSYLPKTLATPPSDEQRAMTAEQVYRELVRVHEESLAHFTALSPDLASPLPGLSPNYTYGAMVEYAVFHIAYHTGQMYTVRHLLGEETPDN